MKTTTLAFDVYGTLIDTHGVVTALSEHLGNRAAAFSHTWRDKQLEYSFRRGIMQHYENFTVCTSQALDHTCAAYNITLDDRQKAALLQTYSRLPAFTDTGDSLAALKNSGHRLFAFSNGDRAAVSTLLAAADLQQYFIDTISADDVQTFKPDPAVYRHFLQQAAVSSEAAWLVSANPFDIIGALNAGMKAAWIKRNEQAVFDPWGFKPTVTLPSLRALADRLIT